MNTGITDMLCRALDARMTALLASREVREAVVKTHVLNRYAIFNMDAGLVITRRGGNELLAKTFEEIATHSLQDARAIVARFRRHLVNRYPFWIPNLFYLAMESEDDTERLARFQEAAALVYDMVIDSDHYAQLLIDCRHDPLHPTHPWPPTNQMPWFLPQRMLEQFRDHWPKGRDVPQIIERLCLK